MWRNSFDDSRTSCSVQMSIWSILERRVLKDPLQGTSQLVKWTSGSWVMMNCLSLFISYRVRLVDRVITRPLDRSIARSLSLSIARSLDRSIARLLDRLIWGIPNYLEFRICLVLSSAVVWYIIRPTNIARESIFNKQCWTLIFVQNFHCV